MSDALYSKLVELLIEHKADVASATTILRGNGAWYLAIETKETTPPTATLVGITASHTPASPEETVNEPLYERIVASNRRSDDDG